MGYFQCKAGCGKCCPDGTIKTTLVPLTLLDMQNLYHLNGSTPERFVDSNVRWKLDGDYWYYLWIPILPTPCPYLTKDRRCGIYYKDEKPLVCKTFPEGHLLPPLSTPLFVYECIDGKSLPLERADEINKLEKERQDLTIKTANYLRSVEVDLRIPKAVEPLIGRFLL